ncbi:phosphohistidine phosphatase SixA [Halomonas aquamarina]|uniref:Phosphohistidine phosphatase SixA n=1 Tax=Vreelandella aquamarina TaxID=77097 RepID=A0ACC5VRW1_9GAMM|nr:phosphohistidine phosphatase SixA [Halomonas aquamarina]MBZ5486628.1 phosphohistidine phosphatase SixA [Halomonas aquamarina]
MSRLLIMRHGEAAPGFPDAKRPLTTRGEYEVAAMAAWLAGRVEQGELARPKMYASPYVRAQQTAGLMGQALGCTVETLGFITPDDDPSEVVEWLLTQPEGAPMLLVSHMPLVGELAGRLLEGRPGQGVGFATAALAELEADVWASGCARLRRFTEPGQLG